MRRNFLYGLKHVILLWVLKTKLTIFTETKNLSNPDFKPILFIYRVKQVLVRFYLSFGLPINRAFFFPENQKVNIKKIIKAMHKKYKKL
jgi:hypothetical protein